MKVLPARDLLLERRHPTPKGANLWAQLTPAQKLAAHRLTECGYELAFIRDTSVLAVFFHHAIHHANSATVSSDGEIDTEPTIVMRT